MKLIRNSIRIIDTVLALLCAVIFVFIVFANENLPEKVYWDGRKVSYYNLFSSKAGDETSVDYQSAQRVSETEQDIMLLGAIPVSQKPVVNQECQTVLVSGNSFGIKLYTNGVIVVGTRDITVNGKTVNPAKEAGISVGDIIVSINSKRVYDSERVEEIINDNNGKSYNIKINETGI
jgi:stage IV sporulation protein B